MKIAGTTIKQVADTNVCIYFLDGRQEAITWWTANYRNTVITDVVKLELLAGGRDTAEKTKIDSFLNSIPVLPTRRSDLQAVESCYRAWDFTTHKSATKLADLVIAKVTMAAGLDMVTLDTKHFCKIPGLKVIKPFSIS